MKEGETVFGNKCRASLYTQKQFSPTCPIKTGKTDSFLVDMSLPLSTAGFMHAQYFALLNLNQKILC